MKNCCQIVIAALLLAATAAIVPAYALPPEFRQLGRGALDLAQKCWGEHGESPQVQVEYCTNAINSHAFTPEGGLDILIRRSNVYYTLGQLDHQMADLDLAVAVAQRINKRSLAMAYNGRCWARAESGHELDQALADCNAAVQIVSDNADYLDSRCLVYYRMGNYPAAISDCTAALESNPKESTSLYVRGLAKLKTGDTTGNADIAAAEALDPKIADTYAGYGVKP